jgi:hypothetical protein
MGHDRAVQRSEEASVELRYESPSGAALKNVRSTLVQSSLQTLRENGLFERYVELLPREFHERVLLTLAPTWLPTEVALAHYACCDRLGLSDAELESFGEAVARRIMGTFLGTMLRSSRNVGSSPWIPLRNYDKLWARVFDGGGVIVMKTGPKDALVDTYGVPMYALKYFRVGHQGLARGTLGMFAHKVFAQTRYPHRVGAFPDQPAIQTKLSWV